MNSVETRKLGKHLFIFEKGKAKNANGKTKERTLITSCESDPDNKLPPEFIKYMRTLFDILDENKTGFVRLSDIEACWGKRNGDSTLQTTRALQYLRQVTPTNGLLSFDRLCMGFGNALHSKDGVAIPNGSVKASNESQESTGGNFQLNSPTKVELEGRRTPTDQRNLVLPLQVNKQWQEVNVPYVKFGEKMYKCDDSGESSALRIDADLRQKRISEQDRPKSAGHGAIKQACSSGNTGRIGIQKDIEQFSTEIRGKNHLEQQSIPVFEEQFGHKPELQKTANFPSKPSKSGQELDVLSYRNNRCSTSEAEKQTRPRSVHFSRQFQQETTNIPSPPRSYYQSSKTSRETQAGEGGPELWKRPRSMVPFSGDKQAVNLSAAKKQGGILEGLQKTDKKAVIDKLKQWRNNEMKKNVRPEVVREFHRASRGYQSDNEGGYNRRKRIIAAGIHKGNETDSENCHKSKSCSNKKSEERVPKTTVYYQGDFPSDSKKYESGGKTTTDHRKHESGGKTASHSRKHESGGKTTSDNRKYESGGKITAEPRDQSKTKNATVAKDVLSTTDEFTILKDGLRIVDEARDCLVKRIADIQEQKLYEQLNNVSPGSCTKTKRLDLETKSPGERKIIEKSTVVVLESSQVEALSTHFKGLKTILEQIKQPRRGR